MSLFDINAVEAEAKKELDEEKSKDAKKRIKAKLAEIDKFQKALANAQREYKELLLDISES